ncbi:hypothetical protein C4566_01920 [Candidatus Parcubacteria bacterium]|nr:MAG: hypothetical protein C4566_01920 [Candidatus Parcubacteria bacterium]
MLCLLLASLLFVNTSEYTVENWYFQEQFSYGSQEEELLHIGSQVIAVGQNCYILDSGLSTIIELSKNNSWKEYSVEGEGPGECNQPNSLINTSDGFVMLKAMPPTLIYTDLKQQRFPKDSIAIQGAIFARNLTVSENNDYFLLNTISIQDGDWFFTLSLLDSGGQRLNDIMSIPRQTQDPFPIWSFRNSWSYNRQRVAVITDTDYSVTVFGLSGEIQETIRGLKNPGAIKDSPLGSQLQGVFYLEDLLLVLPYSSGDILEFHAPKEKKIIRVNGVKASSQAQYFWLNPDTLAVMYGWSDRVFHNNEEEENHQVTFFGRRKP